jgi:hypothetical protein
LGLWHCSALDVKEPNANSVSAVWPDLLSIRVPELFDRITTKGSKLLSILLPEMEEIGLASEEIFAKRSILP